MIEDRFWAESKQSGAGAFVSKERSGPAFLLCPEGPSLSRRIILTGVEQAEILYRPEPGTRALVRFHNADGKLAPPARPDDFEVERGTDPWGDYCRVKNVSKFLFVAIPEMKNKEEHHAN